MKFVLKLIFNDGDGKNLEEVYVSDSFDEIFDILKHVDYLFYELFYIPSYVKLW